jgi:hypothetical protein
MAKKKKPPATKKKDAELRDLKTVDIKTANLKTVDLKSVDLKTAIDFFNCSRQSVYKWVEQGCPRNTDSTYSLKEIYHWKEQKREAEGDKGGSAYQRKLEAEIKWKEAQTKMVEKGYIDRSLHETIWAASAGALRQYLEKSFVANMIHFQGKSLDELWVMAFKFVQEAMEVYTTGKKNAS